MWAEFNCREAGLCRLCSQTGSPTTETRWQLQDHLGSGTIETDASGNIITAEAYHPYGSTAWWMDDGQTEVKTRRFRYTSKERDEETGLQDHGARRYIPWLGRWDGADPAGFVDGTNRYAYVSGNPVRQVDPTGMAPIQNQSISEKPNPDRRAQVAGLIYFPFDSDELDTQDLDVIKQIARDFRPKEFKELRIRVYGAADERGPEAYNQDLSERRALAVAEALGEAYEARYGTAEVQPPRIGWQVRFAGEVEAANHADARVVEVWVQIADRPPTQAEFRHNLSYWAKELEKTGDSDDALYAQLLHKLEDPATTDTQYIDLDGANKGHPGQYSVSGTYGPGTFPLDLKGRDRSRDLREDLLGVMMGTQGSVEMDLSNVRRTLMGFHQGTLKVMDARSIWGDASGVPKDMSEWLRAKNKDPSSIYSYYDLSGLDW